MSKVKKRSRGSLCSILLLSALLLGAPASNCQQGAPQVSVVTLQVVPGPNGSQRVVTPRGFLAPLPGGGVSGNTVQIYMGASGGYWYVDQSGQNVDLTPYVQRMMASQQQASNVPQSAPVASSAPQETSSSGSGSGLKTAAMAGVGAMAGTALVNSLYYNNVPYGTPMYYGSGGRPYYYNSGRPVYVDGDVNLSPNQKAYLYNQHQVKLQQQQQWYQTHQQNKTDAYQSWQQNQTQKQAQNPFVNQKYLNGKNGNKLEAKDAEGGRRFGRRRGSEASTREFSGAATDKSGRLGLRGGSEREAADGGLLKRGGADRNQENAGRKHEFQGRRGGALGGRRGR